MPPLCERCGLPLSWEGKCPGCQRSRLELDGIRSVFRFEGVARQAIHQLKYRHSRALAEPLARLLHDYLRQRTLPADVLVPVPLHSRRLRQRGYNQAAELSRALGRLADLPVVEDSLCRVRDNPPQVRAGAGLRQANVAEAFACRDQRLGGRRVLLVDDVCTTGATLSACGAAVRRCGAASVWALTVAREV